jgi:Ala-tRNA(Pro) deacylase
MSIPQRVHNYLREHEIRAEFVPHSHSHSSISSGVAAQIPIHNIAKAVILEDHEGRLLMAIVPADYKINLSLLGEQLNRSFKLVKEKQLEHIFSDCERGAIPPIAAAYNIDSVYDDSLKDLQDFYLEAGDHELLLHLYWEDFVQVVSSAKHGRFSSPILH